MSENYNYCTSLLEDDEAKDWAMCGICMLLLAKPTTGCPEGHAFCLECYVKALKKSKTCPHCRADTRITK
jgi:hypothetical protein